MCLSANFLEYSEFLGNVKADDRVLNQFVAALGSQERK